MTWQPELDELKQRQTLALDMGGPDKVARHKANGNLTVRERIEGLLDDGSFREAGSASGFAADDAGNALKCFTPANQIIGRGTIGWCTNCPRVANRRTIRSAAKKQCSVLCRATEQFLVEEIINPREARGLLCEFANLAAPLREVGPSRFGMRP